MELNKKYDRYGFRIKPKKNNIKTSFNNLNSTRNTFTILGLIMFFIFSLIFIFMMYISGYIAWYCYANDLPKFRIFKTILASLFCYLYLPYFVFMRIILKVPCL